METIILKLGGALLTNKSRPFTLRYNVIKRIAYEIAKAYRECGPRLIIVHGGGSFGHYVVSEHGCIDTREAISQIVWFMRELNMIIVDALASFGAPVIPFDTHAMSLIESEELKINYEPIRYALITGLIPVLYGDIVLGLNKTSIVSGDEIAWYLAKEFKPSRLLFATTVDGVYDKDPLHPNAKFLDIISLDNIKKIELESMQGFDVTGGMKLKLVLGLKYGDKDIKEIVIFNGLTKNHIFKSVCGLGVYGSRVIL